MDFPAVVKTVKELHLDSKPPGHGAIDLEEDVYGRLCSSPGPSLPSLLASTPGRQTVFIFGSDAVSSVILKQATYEALLSLGFDRPYLYHEARDRLQYLFSRRDTASDPQLVVEKKNYWLLLFNLKACQGIQNFLVTPATWDGVIRIVEVCYPECYQDLMQHLTELKEKAFEHFESEANFKFLDARKNEKGTIPNAPPFYSYEYFCSLSKPRRAWQVRLFLYCEMRLLRLFRGDGYTYSEQDERGCLEYLCPNVPLSAFDPKESIVIPLKVTIPDE